MECESHFEELVRGEEQVACPDCAATLVTPWTAKVENWRETLVAAQSG